MAESVQQEERPEVWPGSPFGDRTQELRRHPRLPATVEGLVQVGSRRIPAIAIDISPGGAFLRCDLDELGPSSRGERLLTLQLPHERVLRVLVEVCWRQPRPDRPGVGVRFLRFLAPPGTERREQPVACVHLAPQQH
jgi:PilZ domain